jgi:photosystem II stability/assembly factor-like uncharacterized protein
MNRAGTAIALLLVGMSSEPSSAALNRWSGSGPDGGTVLALAVDPTSAANLYVGTTGGLFRSTDGGSSWQLAGEALLAGVEISALLVHPDDPDTVFAGTYGRGVFRSGDRGRTFTAVNDGVGGSLRDLRVAALAADPANPQRIWFAADQSSAGGPYLSTDGGATWSRRASGLPAPGRVTALVVNPLLAGELYVAVPGHGLYRSSNGGASWSADNEGLDNLDIEGLQVVPFDLEAPAQTSLARPQDVAASLLLMYSVDPMFKRLVDDGRRLAKRLKKNPTNRFYFDALTIYLEQAFPYRPPVPPSSRPAAVTAGPYANLLVDTEDGPFGTSDVGATWEALGSVPDVARFAAVPATAGRLLAGTRGAGVYVTSDFGRHWSPASRGLAASEINDLAADPRISTTLFAATAGHGVQRSVDAGHSWTARNQGLPADLVVDAIAVDPANPNVLYAATSAGVFRSSNGGASWNQRSSGLTAGCVFDLLIDPQAPSTLYAATCGSGVMRSGNAGASWQSASAGLGDDDAYVLAWDSGTPRRLWAATGQGIFHSTNGGASWTSTGQQQGVSNRPIRALALDPADPQRVYAAPELGGLWWSEDGGATWESREAAVTDPQSGQPAVITSLAVDPVTPTVLYAATRAVSTVPATGTLRGVLRSTNRGSSWSPLPNGLHGLSTQALLIDPLRPSTIYVGTRGAAVRKLLVGSGGPCVAAAHTLCLRDNRFSVKVDWQRLDRGTRGNGTAVALTGDTGAFWFFSAANVELIVKILDGTAINDRFWVFFGALSNVQYTLTVTDHTTGEVRTYVNPQGTQASVGDVDAFAVPASAPVRGLGAPQPVREERTDATTACSPAADRLCLRSGRFAITVEWACRALAGAGRVGRSTIRPTPGCSGSSSRTTWSWW